MMTKIDTKCKICNSDLEIFYKQHNVPVNSVIRLASQEDAINFPKGNIELGFCNQCGFIQNTTFDEKLVTYSTDYNPTQAHSNAFNKFHIDLVKSLVKKYKIENQTIIEIGCGQGEFLDIITQYGNNKAIGFDPACNRQNTDSVEFINDFYSEKYSKIKGDFICSKMTLEHISDVKQFLNLAKDAIKNEESLVFFQVPDVSRILQENAFWDIYYEHCSYFNLESLSILFNSLGLEIIDSWNDFDEQYLMIVAKLGNQEIVLQSKSEKISKEIQNFKTHISTVISFWNSFLSENKNTVLWGGGSKAVAFLSSIKNKIEYVVDIDPLKHNTYIAGTGQQIISPLYLQEIQPDKIIVMNPVYENEIKTKLSELNISAEVLSINVFKKQLLKNIEYRPWGTYEILEESNGYKIKKIEVMPGKRLSLQKHYHRNEHWVVLDGVATVTIDDKQFNVNPNQSTYIQSGQIHRLENQGSLPLVIIEVQVGEYIDEDDIVRFEDDYQRN